MTRRASAALAFALVTSAAVSSSAAAAPPCSTDAFTIDGTPLSLTICDRAPATAAPKGAGVLEETLRVRGRPPLVRTASYERRPSADTTRTIDDVPLAPLGIARTLHVTVAVRGGAVRLEHALLVPGAIALK